MKTKFLFLAILLTAKSYSSDEFFIDHSNDINNGIIKLEESVISTTGFETSIRNVPTNISIITSNEIQEKGYSSVEEVLASQPTINITKDAFGSRIDLRGQGGNKARSNVKILVDGVSIVPLNKSHGTLPLDLINIDNIELIEVIPGGGAVLYGSGTAGGVINIITKTGSGMIPFNKVNFEFGSYGKKELSISSGTLINENFLLQTNLFLEKGEAYLDEKNNKGVNGDILARYKISNKSDISLKFEKSHERNEDPGALLTKKEYEDDRNQIGKDANENQFNETNREAITLTYNNNLYDNLKFSFQTTYQEKNDEFDSDQGSRIDAFENNKIQENQLDIKPKLQMKYGEDNTLVLGYDYNYSVSKRESFSKFKNISKNKNTREKRSVESHSLYALNTYKINKLELIQGVRYNYTENTSKTIDRLNSNKNIPNVSDNMNNMAYELAANYLYSDTGNTYIKWEQGFNTPNPANIFNNPDKIQLENGYKYGMADLKEEIYNSYEIGVRDFIFNTYFSLSAFYSKTENEIYRDGRSDYWVSYNIDETERKGVELYFEQYFGKLTLSEGYSYIDAEITKGKFKGNKVPNVSKNNLTVSAKYEFNNKFNTILTTVFKDAVYIDNYNDGGKVNAYTITNLIFNYKVNEDFKIYIGINNLFNEMYAVQFKKDMYRAADERNYFIGTNYTF